MSLNDLAQYARIVTALIAVAAAIVAVISLLIQRSLARRRAAIDIFLRTEMDAGMLKAWADYNAGIKKFKEAGISVEDFVTKYPKEYEDIRSYLNIHELIAAGVSNKIFDNKICFDFWANVLTRACVDAREIIIHSRSAPGYEYTYHSLTWLNRKWICRKKKWDHASPVSV